MDPLTLFFVSTVVGGFLATWAEASNENAATKEYEFNKSLIEDQKKDAIDLLDLKWNTTLDDASASFNDEIDGLKQEAKNDAFNWNLEAIAAGQQEGNSLNTLAASGVRAGSSIGQAVELQAALNEAQLQNEEDTKRKQIDLGLGQLIRGINSYNGGNNFLINAKQRENTINQYDQQLKKLQYEYDDYMSEGSIRKRFFSNWFSYGSQTANMAFKFSETANFKKISFNGTDLTKFDS